MKLIIDIPDEKYKTFQGGMYCGMLDADLYHDIKNGKPLDDEMQEIRQEIAEYGSIYVEYVAKNRGDRDIELLIEDVLRQAKEQVLEIIDTHISALNNDQFERIWNHTVKEMKRRKIREYETGCTDKKCPFYLNPDYTRCKDCEEKKKAGIMTPVEIARLVAGKYDKHDKEQDKVTQWIKDNADFIKEMARMLEENDNRERSTDNREND